MQDTDLFGIRFAGFWLIPLAAELVLADGNAAWRLGMGRCHALMLEGD